MGLRSAVTILLAVSVLAGGCGGGSEDFEPAPLTTPKSIRDEVWDRSYSECASYTLRRLATKYRVDQARGPVARAVGKAWAEFFGGYADAAGVGREGCLEGMRAK